MNAMRAGGRRRAAALAAMLMVVCVAAASAQFRRGDRFRSIRTPTAETFDGAFSFCRVMFTSVRGGFGGNWSVDYPRADVNLSIRASELTRMRVGMQASGEPNHVVISLSDPELFQCPFVMMTEVG